APASPGPPAEEVVAAPNLTESPRPVPRPAQRITPDPVAPPPPDAAPADVAQEQASPDAAPDAPVVEQAQEETAPEEAATEIVTEAETPQGRLTEIPRPKTRPNRPTPTPAPEVETETAEAPTPQVDDAAVQAALEAAAAAAAPPAQAANVPQGPPLTGSEREGFRVAVNRCWNVDPGSQAARVTMTVGFSLGQDGKVNSDVRQVAASGGDDAATRIAYDAARRAILRCQGTGGYDLPADKYSEWQDVEITFDPSGMRLR
ncbi:MAG: energy transducer TonB, partial [Alphaproteobacteria bacterium]|nr:energy transducer TonB [Alphaproteobacteria bacterium]